MTSLMRSTRVVLAPVTNLMRTLPPLSDQRRFVLLKVLSFALKTLDRIVDQKLAAMRP